MCRFKFSCRPSKLFTCKISVDSLSEISNLQVMSLPGRGFFQENRSNIQFSFQDYKSRQPSMQPVIEIEVLNRSGFKDLIIC